MPVTVTKKDNLPALLKAVDRLVQQRLLVGIPAANAGRDDGPASNAVIGYVQEKGDPAKNIPARPFLVPGVQNALPRAVPKLRAAGEAVLSGNLEAMDAGFHAAGLICVAAVRQKIVDGPFVPLSERTLQERADRGRKGAKAELGRRAAGDKVDALDANGNLISNTNARPLIDKGELRNAVTYVIRQNRS